MTAHDGLRGCAAGRREVLPVAVRRRGCLLDNHSE